MTKLAKSATTSTESVRELDLAITPLDPRAAGLVRDGMCFNKV